jgi:hypothetical protein
MNVMGMLQPRPTNAAGILAQALLSKGETNMKSRLSGSGFIFYYD